MQTPPKINQARTAFLMALGENPDNASAYMEIGKLEFENKRYDASVKWLRRGANIKPKLAKIVRHDNRYQLYLLLAQSLTNVGGKSLDAALTWIDKALKLQPYNPEAKEARELVVNLIQYRDDVKAAFRLIKRTEDASGNVIKLLDSLPKGLEDSPPVIEARQNHTPPTKWPKKSMAIYVGQSPLGIWGPFSMNSAGFGGSEEAVVRLSNELTKLGWGITVFGMPGDKAGDYQGVHWKQYWEMNAKDEFDVLISWRGAHFYDYKFKARKRYLWLHDLMPKDEFPKERIKHFDKAIFVSPYHATRPEFAAIPHKKKFISANGITPDDFEVVESKGLKRNPQRLIYMSANERGLRLLLDIWPAVKAAVPRASLDVYYGWESFDSVNRDNPERMAWKVFMRDKMAKLDGVNERGRIGQSQIVEEIFKSGIWAYPCTFPEVSCITGMKAMAGGAIPVTSDFANLKDLVAYGEQVPMHDFQEVDIKRYQERLISWLLYPEKQERVRREMMNFAREEFDWAKVAASWNEEMS